MHVGKIVVSVWNKLHILVQTTWVYKLWQMFFTFTMRLRESQLSPILWKRGKYNSRKLRLVNSNMDANQERFGCFSVSCTCDSIQIIVGLAGSSPFVNMVMIRQIPGLKGKLWQSGAPYFSGFRQPQCQEDNA